MRLSLGLLAASIGAAVAAPTAEQTVSYKGYQVLRLDTKGDAAAIKSKIASLQYDQWHQDGSALDIALPADQVSAFESLGLDYSVMHKDLGASISAESGLRTNFDNVMFANAKAAVNTTWFSNYHPWADHERYLRNLQAQFPNQSAIVSTGTSYQGRDMFGIHLWGAGGPGKPAVLWHGTVHAREWISAMVVEYLTEQLLTTYDTDAITKSILDSYDFHIFPFVNPDGFVYSQTTNRMWRKNRQPPPSGSCVGRDVNRNWPAEWDSNPDGASPDPCDETYRGEAPSDSPENQGLVAYVDKLRDSVGIKLYIDWHSYGQYILSPWGYTCDILPQDNDEHQVLMQKTAAAIKKSKGKTFTYGPSCATLYATTGDSTDYLHGPGKSDYSITIELRDQGAGGFVLPPSQILPSGEEQWEGMKVLLTSM